MLIPSIMSEYDFALSSLSRRVNANSQRKMRGDTELTKLIKKGEC